MAEPRQTPALEVLEQFPVPVIALADDGAVLFANTAFAEMLGCSRDATSMSYEDIFYALPTEDTLFAVTRLRADTIGELLHLDGSTLFAKMSKSAMMRGADSVAIATFADLMERLSGLAEDKVSPVATRQPGFAWRRAPWGRYHHNADSSG
jgi:PAS domain-containing protein